MWLLLYFIKAKGYDVTHNILYQDNKSTILLATNGRMSSSKRTKHTQHWYFLVKDKVDCGELKIQHESTDKIWSSVLTKPKQGRPFYLMRVELMNCPVDYDDAAEAVLTHPKLLPRKDEGVTTSTLDKAILKKAVFDSYMLMSKQSGHIKHRRSVLGDLGNKGLPEVKKGVSAYSWVHLKDAPAGAWYPAHAARMRFESIQTGWIPPKY